MIKDLIWFLKESKKHTGHSYLRIILIEKGLKRGITFAKSMKKYRTH